MSDDTAVSKKTSNTSMSDDTSASKNTSNTPPSRPSPSLPNQVPMISNIKNHIPIELSFVNFLTWKNLFQTFLKSQQVYDLVEGLIPCPSATDPLYSLWIQCDTTVHSWINASLSIYVLETLLNYGCPTSHAAWVTLEKLFLDHATSTFMHLKETFQNFSKDPSSSMESYL